MSVPTVVITGGNAGIGKETAVGLGARRHAGGHHLTTTEPVEAPRSKRSGQRGESDTVEMMELDLADFGSIRRFADDYLARHERLDVLVNNAGLVLTSRRETVDGFETTIGVNHLGPFLLTQLLLDRIRASAPARVVVVSSHAHKGIRKGLDFDDLQSDNGYSGFRVYGRTKLANIYFTRELARRLEGTGVTANALHPGFVASRFGRDGDSGRMGDVAMALGRPFAISAEKGARTSIYLATSPDVADVTGGYFYKCRPSTPTKIALDDEAARRLWAVSEELVASAS